jgi:hypothetical protein
VLGVALLAGAAFMAARLLNSNTADGPNALLSGLGGPGGSAKAFRIEMTPAPEMPKTRADLVGSVTSLKDNSIFVSATAKGSGQGLTLITGGVAAGDSGATPTPSGNCLPRMPSAHWSP